MKFSSYLKRVYSFFDRRLIIILLLSLVFFLIIDKISKIIVVSIFVLLSGTSKLYHKFFKSSVGIDLVLFTTAMTILVYENLVLALIVAYLGLFLADFLAGKLSHTSLVSIIGLTITVVVGVLLRLNIIYSAIILLVIYDVMVALMYYFLGSSLHRITMFVSTHFFWNIFLILTFAEKLKEIMLLI